MRSTIRRQVPEQQRQLITYLRGLDEETNGHPVVPSEKVALAREWLARVLIDGRCLTAHLDLLNQLYRAKFHPSLPRTLMGEGMKPSWAEPSGAFRHFDLLEREEALALARGGLSGLQPGRLAELLLNPAAVWDLSDLVNFVQPDYWLGLMDQVGRELIEQEGIHVTIPGVDDRPTPSRGDSLPGNEITAVETSASELSGSPGRGSLGVGDLSEREVLIRLNLRILAEAESLYRLGKLSSEVYSRVVEDLDALVREMQHCSGRAFQDRDIRFHLRIAEAANSPLDVRKVFEFNYSLGGMAASVEESRGAICLEHQRIVDALRQRDFEEAATASRQHLQQVFHRWFPNHATELADHNRDFFAPLGSGGALLFSGMVYPVEWVKDWSTLGKEVAAAVGRGAELWYFTFADRLIKRWRDRGLDLDMPDVADMQEKLASFQDRIAQELETSAGSRDRALQLVQQRVFLLPLDSDALFLLARPAQTLGYFLYPDRPHLLTQRVFLSANVAWPKIESISSDNDDLRKLFLITLKESLEKLRLSARDTPEGELAARCLGKWWPSGSLLPVPGVGNLPSSARSPRESGG
jgi:hypothetical protein